MPMTKILLANDGSEGAFKALGTAISLAKHYQAELHMICVEELPMLPASIDEVVEEREEANHRYEKVIERAQSLCYMQDVDVHTHILYGHPVPSIIDFIQKHGIDHLVIGFMDIRLSIIGSSAASRTSWCGWRRVASRSSSDAQMGVCARVTVNR
jgi:nucleotide-binding universal stress UspA family protein